MNHKFIVILPIRFWGPKVNLSYVDYLFSWHFSGYAFLNFRGPRTTVLTPWPTTVLTILPRVKCSTNCPFRLVVLPIVELTANRSPPLESKADSPPFTVGWHQSILFISYFVRVSCPRSSDFTFSITFLTFSLLILSPTPFFQQKFKHIALKKPVTMKPPTDDKNSLLLDQRGFTKMFTMRSRWCLATLFRMFKKSAFLLLTLMFCIGLPPFHRRGCVQGGCFTSICLPRSS